MVMVCPSPGLGLRSWVSGSPGLLNSSYTACTLYGGMSNYSTPSPTPRPSDQSKSDNGLSNNLVRLAQRSDVKIPMRDGTLKIVDG